MADLELTIILHLSLTTISLLRLLSRTKNGLRSLLNRTKSIRLGRVTANMS
jgi:hypothetical protein